MQRVPDIQQDPFAIFTPLAVPKAEDFDGVGRQETFPRLVAFELFRRPVLESIQFDHEPRERAIEIEKVRFVWVLAAELESGEPARAKRPPELLLFFGLISPEAPGIRDGVHGGNNSGWDL